MSYQTHIADQCRLYGLEVIEVDGWQTRGSSSFNPYGVVDHHTAGSSTGDMPSLGILINGRSDLPGPLCNVGLSRSGKCYIVAAGRANHAGAGGWKGLSGNSSVFGIEAENNGTQPWPEIQLKAYYRLVAALISLCVNHDVAYNCGHKEWAPTRKVDPHSLDMNAFRAEVAKITPSAPTNPTEKDVTIKVWGTPNNPELSMCLGKDKDSMPWKRFVILDGETASELVTTPGVIREQQPSSIYSGVRQAGVIKKA